MPAAAPADDEEAGEEAPAAEETDSSVEYPIPCQGMGLEEITEIYQNAYNEYIGA